MTFQGIHNQYAELYILEIDKTQVLTENNDLWLKIFLNVSAFMGSWQAADTSLTLNDARRLIRWLEDLSSPDKEASNHLFFAEPNLSFYHLNTRETGKTIKLDFNLELRPGDAKDKEKYFLTCRLSDAQLAELADDLAYDLQTMLDRASGIRTNNSSRIINDYEFTKSRFVYS